MNDILSSNLLRSKEVLTKRQKEGNSSAERTGEEGDTRIISIVNDAEKMQKERHS